MSWQPLHVITSYSIHYTKLYDIRPSFTLGGTGGGIAYNMEEYTELALTGLDASPTDEILVEESVIGWKEFELEVMRDLADNVVIICSIENVITSYSIHYTKLYD